MPSQGTGGRPFMDIVRFVARASRRVEKSVCQLARPQRTAGLLTVLVPGVQRSGTNMMMDVLEQSLDTAVFHETDRRAFDGYYLRPLPRLLDLRAKCRAPFFVLKALLDSHMTAELMSYLAPAKAIWIYRRFDDMVNSNLLSWPGGRNQIEDLMCDPLKTGYRARGMTAETLATVRAHYRPGMSDASAIALFWYYRNQLFFDQRLDSDPHVLLLRYEDIVTQPVPAIQRTCAFLGLGYSDRMGAEIHAQSVGRRPPADITPEIRTLCDGMMARLDQAFDEQMKQEKHARLCLTGAMASA